MLDVKIEVKNIIKYTDNRGYLASLWKEENGIKFVEDRISYSKYGTIRGFHGDAVTWKLCVCIKGSIKLVVWDIKKQDKYEFNLNENLRSILVPPYFLLAHQCIEDSILLYKWSVPYSGPEDQWSVKYDDPTINANWIKTSSIILSKRDSNAKTLMELKI